jgi:hypothetical protein
MDARERVFAEMAKFHEALPELLREHQGKWIVFKDGAVQSLHDDEDSAYWAGLKAFGAQGGQVIVLVEEEGAPVPLTASLMFAIA